MTQFQVEGVPVTQGSMKSFGRGRMVHSNHKALTEWRLAIAEAAKAANHVLIHKPNAVALAVEFVLPRPKTVKRLWPTAKLDLDKLIRAVGDALTGIAYEDDGQITVITASKYYADSWVGANIGVSQVR